MTDSVGAGRRGIAGTVLGLGGTLLLAGVGVLAATLPPLAPSLRRLRTIPWSRPSSELDDGAEAGPRSVELAHHRSDPGCHA